MNKLICVFFLMMGFVFVNFWGRNPLSFGRSWIMSRQAAGEGGRIGGGLVEGGLVEVEGEERRIGQFS